MQTDAGTGESLLTVRPVPWWRTWRASLAAVFLLVVLAVAISEVVHVVRAQQRAEAEALERSAERAESLATATEIFIDRYSVIAQTTAQALFAGRLSPAERRALLVTIRRTHPEIVSLAAILPDGTVAEAEPRESVPAAVAERTYFRRIVAGAPLMVSDLLVGQVSGSLEIVVAAAARSPDGALLGVVAVRPAIDRLVREVRPTLDKGAQALVVDSRGRVVVHDIRDELSWDQRDYSRVPLVAEALAGRRAASARFESPVDGTPVLGAAMPIASLGWAAGVVQPVESALASVVEERGVALVAVVIILLLGVTLALITADRLSRPILALSEGVTALSRGDLGQRVKVDARNELGQLADLLNAMAATLETARDRERTAVAETRSARDRIAFLAEASSRMGASLDYEATLRTLCRLVVPALADGCLVALGDTDHAVRPLALADVDPAREALLAALYTTDEPRGRHPAASAFQNGKPELVTEVTDAWMESVTQGARQLDLLRCLGLRSFMAVPLLARGRTLGVISFFGSSRRYGAEDLQLATELAQRAAVAVDNARLFRAAQEAIRQAQAAVRSRDAFLARASHELRTPLTSALGNVRLLGKAVSGALKEGPDALIAVAARNLEQMAALIEDLLDASKLAVGQERLALSPVDLASVLSASADVVGAEAREKGVALVLGVPQGGPVLGGDRVKLEQVFTNLLANAVKFTPPGGEVHVSASVNGNVAEVRVRDTGDGIGGEELDRIFEPFYQAPNVAAAQVERPRRRRGTGLGLAICRQIVTLHGGQIWAESDGAGRGSTFVVRLPYTAAGDRAA